VGRMPEDQKFIYYASGDSIEKIDKSPQIEAVLDKGYEFLYFTEEIDEFAINVLMSYSDKEFRSVAGKDTGIEPADKALDEKVKEESADLLRDMKELLKDRVSDVKLSTKLRKHPVCLSSEGELTIEMEKVLNTMPDGGGVKAQKVLEINPDHKIYKSLIEALASDKEKLSLYTDILYNQALLIEGLPIEDPVDFADKVSKLMG